MFLSGRYSEITMSDASETCQTLPNEKESGYSYSYSSSSSFGALKWQPSNTNTNTNASANANANNASTSTLTATWPAACNSSGSRVKPSDVCAISAEAGTEAAAAALGAECSAASARAPRAGAAANERGETSASKQSVSSLAARFPRAQQALALAICLGDGLLNQFRDQNFESAPLCACSNSVRGAPGDYTELYLPPIARLALADDSPLQQPCAAKHSCGFNALGLRSHACSAALFADDIADIFGALPAERWRAYQFGTGAPAAALTEREGEGEGGGGEAARSGDVPRALALYDSAEASLCGCQSASLFAGYVSAAADERATDATLSRALPDWLVNEQTSVPAGVSLLARLLEPPACSPFAQQLLSALADASVTQYLDSLLSWLHGTPNSSWTARVPLPLPVACGEESSSALERHRLAGRERENTPVRLRHVNVSVNVNNTQDSESGARTHTIHNTQYTCTVLCSVHCSNTVLLVRYMRLHS